MNPQGGTPPVETRFGKDKQPANPGRTPTAWLRKFLDAAHDKGPEGKTRREAIAEHLFELATSYSVVMKGHGENALELASGKDSIEAAKLLMQYDMGKPVEAIELTSPDGTMSPTRIDAVASQLKAAVAAKRSDVAEAKQQESTAGGDDVASG